MQPVESVENRATDQARTNILPFPKERAAEALRAARGDEVMSQIEKAGSTVRERPVILLAAAALVGFALGRLVGR